MMYVQFSSSCNALTHNHPGIFSLTTTSQKVNLTLPSHQVCYVLQLYVHFNDNQAELPNISSTVARS